MSILADEVQMKGLTGMLVPTPVATVHRFRSQEEQDATARLIAAAPDMLAALRNYEIACCMFDAADDNAGAALDAARAEAAAALAKVEGR
jgi:hypothetical protein